MSHDPVTCVLDNVFIYLIYTVKEFFFFKFNSVMILDGEINQIFITQFSKDLFCKRRLLSAPIKK